MLENYTTNDLILYLYNETGLEDSVFIQKAIDHNEEVAEEFHQLAAVKSLIEHTFADMPSRGSVNAIMAYSGLHSCI
jgi:hypothetical protein